TRAGEGDRLSREEAESTAGEVRVVEDRIEPLGAPVGRIVIARRIKEAGAIAQPILVIGEFDREEPRVDVRPAPRDRVEALGAQRLVKLRRDVESPDMPIRADAQVIRANVLLMNRSDRLGAN